MEYLAKEKFTVIKANFRNSSTKEEEYYTILDSLSKIRLSKNTEEKVIGILKDSSNYSDFYIQ
ncbi:MAG: hypothetical protein ACE5KT_01905 [Methanosarcinales archaeon]